MAEFGDIWVQFKVFFVWLWSFFETKFIISHIAVNFLVAVIASVYSKEFLLGRTFEFLYRKAIPLVALFATFAFFGDMIEMPGIATAVFVVLETKLLADLLDNMKKFGINLPGWTGRE